MTLIPGQSHPLKLEKNWKDLQLPVGYANLERLEDEWRLWFGASFQGGSHMIRLQGKDLGSLKRVPPQFSTALVNDYDRDLDGIKEPILSRALGCSLKDGTQLVYGGIGPRYTGGGTELFPQLFRKAPGGKWESLGVPAGDPQAFVAEARRLKATLRCEGGGLLQLPDGRLRLYLHGMCDPAEVAEHVRGGRVALRSLLVAEAEQAEGPWRFVRDEAGKPIDVFAGSTLPWVFPHVQSLGEGKGVLLSGASNWPPKELYAAYSSDGLRFAVPADEQGKALPLTRVTDLHADARFGKILRAAPDTQGAFAIITTISRANDRGLSRMYLGRGSWEAETAEALFLEVNKGFRTE